MGGYIGWWWQHETMEKEGTYAVTPTAVGGGLRAYLGSCARFSSCGIR